MSIASLEKKFKRERKEITRDEKEQKEFIKDLEVVFNDFIDMKFDANMSAQTKKQFEADEETLREMLKKMVKLSGIKPVYVEKCKEWLREMLKTGKRKRPQAVEADQEHSQANPDEEFDNEGGDDIILDDSENEGSEEKKEMHPEEPHSKEEAKPAKKRGRKPKSKNKAKEAKQKDAIK